MYSITLTLLQLGDNPNMVAGCGGSGKSTNFGRPISNPRRPRDKYMGQQTNHQVLFLYCQTLINKDQLSSDPDQNLVGHTHHLFFCFFIELIDCFFQVNSFILLFNETPRDISMLKDSFDSA